MHQNRIKILAGIIIALLSLLVFRLGYVQLIEGSKYSGISDKHRIKKKPLEALRGGIFDCNGSVLATNRHSFNISVKYNDLLYYYLRCKGQLFPRLTRIKAHKNDKESCFGCHNEQESLFRRLSDVIDADQDTLFEIAEETVKNVEMIKDGVNKRKGKEIRIVEEISLHPVVRDVSFERVAEIESRKMDFPGIFVEIEPHRWYPNNNLASHVIGYTDEIKKEEWAGRVGIEAYYNIALMGRPGERFEEITYENSRADKIIIERPSNSGENIFLTIDSGIQLLAEEALGDRMGAVIVMNPWNGEIAAMASNTRFNPNTFNKDFNSAVKDKRKPLLNRPIQSALPPGSLFKIVTATASLAEGTISGQTVFECQGHDGDNPNRFRCSSKYGHGLLNVEEALQYSCNVFFFKAAKQLGGNLLHKWSRKLGFGQPSGIDIPYERKGLMPEPKSTGELMNISIGQGNMLATPLQVTKMIAMIANGGKDVKPHLLKKIERYSGDVVIQTDTENNHNLQIPESVVTIIKHGLVKVVADGTAKKTGIDKYLAAGKTGTAETRSKNDNHAWFTGFVPYDNPKYCFTVLIEHTPMHAAEATAPVLQALLAGLFPERS